MSYDLKDGVVLTYSAGSAVCKNAAAQSDSEEREPNAGGTNKSDKSDNDECKTEGSATDNTDRAGDLDWKITDASTFQS